MSLVLILPVVVASAGALTASVIQPRLRPQWATRALTAVAVGTALAVLWGLGVVVLGTLAEVPWVAERVGWCHHFHQVHRPLPWAAGPIAGVWLGTATIRLARVGRRHRRLFALGEDGPPIEIIASAQPTAYTLPGRPGRLVVTAGMLDALSFEERRVLFAHERSHLDNRHARYLQLADLAVAAVPFLARLAHQVRFATERWADEDAAAEVGDRRLVARALSRAALAQSDAVPVGALPAAATGMVARVDALLADHRSPAAAHSSLLALGIATLVALGGSTLQFHHLIELADHVCPV